MCQFERYIKLSQGLDMDPRGPNFSTSDKYISMLFWKIRQKYKNCIKAIITIPCKQNYWSNWAERLWSVSSLQVLALSTGYIHIDITMITLDIWMTYENYRKFRIAYSFLSESKISIGNPIKISDSLKNASL